LGKARGAFLLATSRQGTCFVPILYPLVYFFQENGILAVQAVADILSLVMAVPIAIMVTREVKAACQKLEKETELST
jgi:Na+-driven multidrug efflux pump